MVPFDAKARERCAAVVRACQAARDAVILYTQWRPDAGVSPGHPNWGKPNPIDITGLLETAFAEGIRFANETQSVSEKAHKTP